MCITFSCTEPQIAGSSNADTVTLPEPLDLSQDRAFALLRLLGLPEKSEGALEASKIPEVRQRLLVALNSKSARSSELVPAYDTGTKTGPRFVHPAFTDAYLARMASNFMEFFGRAQAAQCNVVWS